MEPEEEVIVEETPIEESTDTPIEEPVDNDPVVEESTDTPQELEPEEPPSVDWEKRYNDQQAYVGTQSSEIHRLRQSAEQYKELGDPQEAMQQLRQFREQSEKQELKQWNSRSPDYSRFQSVRSKAETLNGLIRDASSEQRDAIQQSVAGQFSSEDQAMLMAYNEHQAVTQRQLAEDPESFINNIVQGMIQDKFNDYESYQGHRASTDTFMNENENLIQKHGDDFMRIIGGQGSNRELAVEYVQMKEEIEKMKSQLGQSFETNAQADAQNAALKQSASVKRDLNTSVPRVDPVQLAEEKGLNGLARLRFIENYNKAN